MSKAMIVAPQPDAVEAGARVLQDGGNAVDAALACAFVQTVVDPLMCGIAGFGSLQVLMPSKSDHEIIDFHGRVPSAATPDMWQDRILGETDDGFGFVLKDAVNDLGYQSITTPGTLKAFEEAHSRYGSLPWSRILAPAITFAAEGYVLAPEVYYYWVSRDAPGRIAVRDRLAYTPSGRTLYCGNDGAPKAIGSVITNPGMAATYQRIADQGSDVFYRGDIAAAIDDDMKAHGGLLSAGDLASYRTVSGEPLWGSYRGLDFSTNRPPGGGIMLVEMLNILENFDLAAMGHNTPDYMRVVAEAMKIATADKDNFVGDPAFFDVPRRAPDRQGLCSRTCGRDRTRRYGAGRATGRRRICRHHPYQRCRRRRKCGYHDPLVRHDVGRHHRKSGVHVQRLHGGFRPPAGPRRIAGARQGAIQFGLPNDPFSGGKPDLILGAPGGTQIAMGVLQVMLNVVDFGMNVQEAVLAPRFSATSDTLTVTARIPRYAYRELEERGYHVARSPYSYEIASVHALKANGDGWTGAADIPYGGGMALGV